MNISQDLSRKVRQLRLANGLTQEELAQELGVAPLHISRIERGTSGMSLELMISFCKCVNITMADLVPIDENEDIELKIKWIGEISETLEKLNLSQVGLIKAMICSLSD